jgi:hypothetical protein
VRQYQGIEKHNNRFEGWMNTCIYDKTDKGREEIATRKYQVPPKLRTLLVMIDGRHSLESLLKNFAVLGLSKDNVDELAQQGFIALVRGAGQPEAPEADAPPPPRPPASARARTLERAARRQQQLAEEQRAPQASTASEAPAAEPSTERPARRGFLDYFNLASDSVNFSES